MDELGKLQKKLLIGIEIRDDSISVSSSEFRSLVRNISSCAFVLGNEGTGMSRFAASKCDKFLYIPQYGGGTASLNVAVAGSIIFQKFSELAAYQEWEREKEKFVVEELSIEQKILLNTHIAVEKRALRSSQIVEEIFASDLLDI